LRVVVTGGAGFIGSHVAEAFLARGDDVLVVDDLSAGREENVPDGAELVRADVVDPLDVSCDLVCHLAAQASVTASVDDPQHDARVNVLGTLRACELGVPVIYAATGGALYGDQAPRPTREDFLPAPQSPYGASKYAGEAYVGAWGKLHSLPNVVLRLANVYGPRQTAHGEAGVVAIFSSALARGEPPTLRGGGTQTRDYVHVSDVAAAFVRAAESQRAGVYNVSSGLETTTSRVLELLQDAAGTSLEPEREPLKPGEMEASALDPSLARERLGWAPTIAVEDGLRETYRWYASRGLGK
jgi:UDP-glucose 4-epimerase